MHIRTDTARLRRAHIEIVWKNLQNYFVCQMNGKTFYGKLLLKSHTVRTLYTKC